MIIHTLLFLFSDIEVIFSFNEQMIQINNYLWVALFLFSNTEVKNYLNDFILLILIKAIIIQINNYLWVTLFFPLII